MPIPDFIIKLREKIGTDELWLPGVTAVIIRDVPEGAPITAVPEVLLVKRSDNGDWTPVTGIADPGEDPHQTAVREAKEEVGLDVQVEALLGVGAVGPVTYSNGDNARYMDTAVRCSVIGDSDEPVISDDENTEAGWFSIMHMPPMNPRFRLIVGDAVAQLRRPEGFRPRMGYVKRDRTR